MDEEGKNADSLFGERRSNVPAPQSGGGSSRGI